VTDHSNYHAWVRANARRDERRLGDQELIAWIVEVHTTYPAYRGRARHSRAQAPGCRGRPPPCGPADA
jgi:hypothetical protein